MPGEELSELAVVTDAALLNALTLVGIELTNAVKLELSRPGTGRVYSRRSVKHQASSPGSPPAVDTGRYRGSWNWQVGEDGLGRYVDVGTNVDYGPFLEFGTSIMAARPHLRPAVELIRNQIQALVVEAITKAQRAAVARMPREIIIEG